MNNDFFIDEKLKDKSKRERIKIPKSLDEKIETTLNNLGKSNKNNSKIIKRSIVAASITLVVVTTFGLSIPSYAKNLPIIGSIFKLLNEDKNLEEYSSEINITKESKGVKVTINSIVYDGINLNVAYTVETEKSMTVEPHILDKDFKINGKITTFGSSGNGKFINQDNTVYKGIDTFSVNSSYIPGEVKNKMLLGGNVEVPDSFNLDINIKEFLGDIKGKWNFKIPVTKDKVNGNIKEVDLNINLSNILKNMKIYKLISTPINTVIYGEGANTPINEQGDFDLGSMMYYVYDDKGRAVLGQGMELAGDEETCYFKHEFKEIYDDSESLTLIPIKSKENVEPNNIEAPLNLGGNTSISGNNVANLTITKVENLEDKTKVYFNSKYPTIMYPHTIVDNLTGDIYDTISSVQSLDNGKDFYIEFKKLKDEGNYIVKCRDISKDYIIYEQDKFTVSLK